MSADKSKTEKSELLKKVEADFSRFIELNPSCNFASVTISGDEAVIIHNPWGDSSVKILIPENYESFAKELNNVHLPERYSALYHVDMNALEVIFTARPLGEHLGDITERSFTFTHRGRDVEAKYAASSERLLMLASEGFPSGQSLTQHRNLESFFDYAEHRYAAMKGRAPKQIGDPISFWVHNIKWDEDEILTLANELNFYMTYYDIRSPAIVVHSPKLESPVAKPHGRFRDDSFPKHIRSSPLDINMLRFWMAARGSDPASRFIYNYRIIEYASFSYLERNVKYSLKRIISAPNALDNVQKLTEDTLSIMHAANVEPHLKIEKLLREIVPPAFLWKNLSYNLEAYRKPTHFDGGFTVDAIIKEKTTEADFKIGEIVSFANAIRSIRNALSHGRDQKTTSVIAPTAHNFEKLQPWASVVTAVAGEIIIYRDIE